MRSRPPRSSTRLLADGSATSSALAAGRSTRRYGSAPARRVRLLGHAAAILIEEAVARLVEPLRQLTTGFTRNRHQPGPRGLRLSYLLGHRAPLVFLAGASADCVGGKRLTQSRGQILRRRC